MAVNLSPYGGVGAQFLDNSGNVLTGGKIYTYAAGTTTPQATYTSSTGGTPHPNPIILDAAGRVPSGGEIWLTDGLSYKFILRDANDVLIATYDNVTGINSNFVAFTNQQEIQTAIAGQTVFNLTTMSYQPGTNSLSVFVDGVNQYGPGAQYAYLETDSDTITFVNGLHVGAEVKFTTSQLNSSGLQANAFQVSYVPPFTNSVATNVGDKLAQTVSVKDFGAVGDGLTDDTTAVQNAVNVSKNVYFPEGTYKITSEVTLNSNIYLYGDGQGATTLLFYKASNPVTSEFMLAARYESNILIEKMTLKSNAFADGLFDVGTYNAGPPKTYTGTYNGNINGVLISSCSNVTMRNCEITGFNYDGVRVSVEGGNPLTDFNYNLTFDNIYGHHCLVTPVDILGTRDFKVVNCTFTDNGNFTANYIDGGAGYGVVLGRLPSINQLRSFGGLCANNFTARNARHGIDVHAGANIIIQGNLVEDNLLQGISVQDNSGSADDSFVGDISVIGNTIYHTDWVEAQYPLITWEDAVTERIDSCPIYVSQVGAGLLQNTTITNNTVRSWRFRQLVNNIAGTDLIGFLAVWVVNNAVISNNNFEQTNVNYLPSFGIDLTSVSAEIVGNSWLAKQRSTVSKPFFLFGVSVNASVSNNKFELSNVYTDQGTTQAAYPTFKQGAGQIAFVGNTIVQSSQGTRGSLWYTTSTNQRWGFNGILATNCGNMLKVGGTTWVEYASKIKGSLSIYASAAGASRYDGFSSGNPFLIDSATQLELVLGDLPFCESGLTFYILDQINLGATGPVTIPVWQDNIQFEGNSADNTNSMTKTAGVNTTAGNAVLFECPTNSKNIDFQYIYFKGNAFAGLVRNARNVNYCAFDTLNAAASGIIFQQRQCFARTNRFKGGNSGILAERAAAVVSQLNDSDATQPAYGLIANGAAIYKNSTQPTGSTANELTQNGGTIA